ncbi:hypothetical protein DTW90_17040 [Neorhizobium sp. P12A]|nr:hypothetical protein DTW90_17040 [Neorhizobium sp. P12A]
MFLLIPTPSMQFILIGTPAPLPVINVHTSSSRRRYHDRLRADVGHHGGSSAFYQSDEAITWSPIHGFP